jgi:hypothetical protein
MQEFGSVDDIMDPNFSPPVQSQVVCREATFGVDDALSCSLFWCEVDASIEKSSENACKCFRKYHASCKMELRVIGGEGVSISDIDQHILNGDVTGVTPGWITDPGASHEQPMASILLEEWETGEVALQPMKEVKVTLAKDSSATSSTSCGWQELCYCETHVCRLSFNRGRASTELSGWQQVSDLRVAEPGSNEIGGRLLYAPHRSLSVPLIPSVPTSQRAGLSVVWGIQVADVSSLLGETEDDERWSYMESFELSAPWAQRNLYSFCTNLPDSLRVVGRRCWIEDFRRWLVTERSERFPVTANLFDGYVQAFVVGGLTDLVPSKEFMWLEGNKVKATYSGFSLDVNNYEPVESALRYQRLWDEHLAVWNDDASRFARGAWHTSNLWVRAEAQAALISSTVMTLAIVLCLAFLGMLIFTFDIVLSSLVVCSTICAITWLAFFIISIMGWPIGPVEVIALIVFIGYAVTYSLHIAHKYGSGDALRHSGPRLELRETAAIRFQRTEYALKSIGSAALGSAATTVGCATFLLFCTLTIFQKLGGVVLVVTVISIFIALVPLPALLFIVGPVQPGRCRSPWEIGKSLWEFRKSRKLPQSQTALADARSPQGDAIHNGEMRPAGPSSPHGMRHMKQVEKPLGMRPSIGPDSHRPMPPTPQSANPPSPRSASPPVLEVLSGHETNADDVKIEAGDFNIGQESRLAPIWMREEERDHGDTKSELSSGQLSASGSAMRVSRPAAAKIVAPL